VSAPSYEAVPSAGPDPRDAVVTKRHKVVRVKEAEGVWKRTTSDGRVRRDIVYLDRNGKQRSEAHGVSLREAKRLRAEKMATRPEERRAPSRETFADVAALWWEQKRSKLRDRTATDYQGALDLVCLPHFGKWPIRLIDADAIASLIRSLETEGLRAIDPQRPKRPLGRSACLNYTKPLAQILAFAARRGYLQTNPWLLLTKDDRPTQGEPRPIFEWTSEAIGALLAASKRLAETKAAPEARPYDYEPLLRVAVTLGLRQGEILGLRWGDLAKDENGAYSLRIERQWLRSRRYGPPKTDAGKRTVAVPPDLAAELVALRLRSRFSDDESPMFASMAGTPLNHRNVARRGFEAARDAAGLPEHLVFHDTRHASASRMIDAGLDPVTVAAVLGHEDPHVTLKIYAARFDRQAKDDRVRAALAGVKATDA
jgi:integrase